MREFAFGTSAQFEGLQKALNEGKKYKFADRQLPDTCSPKRATIWFAKVDNVYAMYIDKGITTTANHQDLKLFLEKGETKFICMEDMICFLQSLQTLFEVEEEAAVHNPPSPAVEGGTGDRGNNEAGINQNVVDKEKLKELRKENKKTKMVWPEELAEPLKRKVFGQDKVIEELTNKVVINQMRKDKKLLAIVLIGPTATGKSETAKSLAEIMTEAYGEQYGFIEIAANELTEAHSVQRFFGAPPSYVGHGGATVFDDVRKNPRHVIVINEIEKAHEKILVGLMEAIDTGSIGMADNSKPINLNQCILLFTSNIKIDMDKYKEAGKFERAEMCRDVFTKHCGRPEISGKIGNFLVFEPLEDDAVTDIIVKFVREELSSFDLKLAHIDEYLMADFLKHQTSYGARGIRDLVREAVGNHLLQIRKLNQMDGKEVILRGTIENIEFKIA